MDGPPSLHLVVFPWLAFGHLMPFLELSKSLAKRGHLISFLSTPRNLQRLPSIPPTLSHLIRLVPLPLPPSQHLPAGAEATIDVPADQVPHLKRAFDGLQASVTAFLSSATTSAAAGPHWIIQDFASYWLPPIASTFGIPCIYFTVFPVTSQVFHGSPDHILASKTVDQLTVPPAWMAFPSAPAFRLHEARAVVGFHNDDSSGVTDAYRLAYTVRGCLAIALRSCRTEFGPEWLSLLRDVCSKPVVPVGLLPPVMSSGTPSSKVFDWLSKQSPASVLYVALGSEAALSDELVQELALGLELSSRPFLWALRKPAGRILPEGAELLPEGFEERTKSRGLVVMQWVPQLDVLAHTSIGSFLTHCGWSSVIEGLTFGLPLVLLPMFVDQGLTAQLLAAKGLGVEVERREEDGVFTSEAVAKAVRTVMSDEQLRANAEKMKAVFGDVDHQESYFNDFNKFLNDKKQQK